MNQTFELCHKMKIPDRLDRLMSRLTQEIIRQQPENVYEFAANLFEQLLEERNGGKYVILRCVYTRAFYRLIDIQK